MRDEALKERIHDVYTSNYRVYGARKIWRELNRQGHAVARCTVERLMRELGIQGAVRGRRVVTTIPGGQVQRAPDLVDRDFVAAAPNRCWVADFTHVKTWSATVYVAFVVDTFSRRIVGWSAATVKETVFVLDALEMALWQRNRDQQSIQPGELIHQILDERAYTQALVLMKSAPEQVSTFVVTNAYRKAARALRDHGFVLLLGDPAVGKSVIALMLASSAADNWGCVAIKPRTSDELERRARRGGSRGALPRGRSGHSEDAGVHRAGPVLPRRPPRTSPGGG
ncbi:hypothetical protein GCM10010269_16300 [Streptomyces humidus]|uniref:Integrase catalytic domain-containing protein n=1 Tax=Streptomyces humidus TaxID=52259 RepID=A0A918FTC9_9ACTN|nr:hypothetical protein GCM10010269_16300 [Streptomyces humidus]